MVAPFKGIVKPISEAPDEVFASGAMGDGIVITPKDNTLFSPVNGEIMMIFPTKHALGIKAENGSELLIHVGMDTVNLEGKPFDVLVKEGDTVKAGQPLMRVDFDQIKDAGLPVETPVIVTNGTPFDLVRMDEVEAGDLILEFEN